MDTNIVYNFTYYLILGTVSEIRDWVYAQAYRPGCNFVFKADRCHWSCRMTTDAGWPVTNYLTVSLNSSDPQLWASRTAFYATNAPVVYIRAAYHMAHPAGRAFGQVFWESNGTGWWSEARSVTFPVLTDDQFHTYAVNLAASTNYTGLITQFRFDPAYAGEAGDWVKVAAITSAPFAEEEAGRPGLSGVRTNGGALKQVDF